nr:hypothetical protein [uncultured Sphaerochaeta sp.]
MINSHEYSMWLLIMEAKPPFLSEDGIAKIVGICRDMGAGTAVSSRYTVNAWFGSFDKYEGSRAFFTQVLGLDEQEMLDTGLLLRGCS